MSACLCRYELVPHHRSEDHGLDLAEHRISRGVKTKASTSTKSKCVFSRVNRNPFDLLVPCSINYEKEGKVERGFLLVSTDNIRSSAIHFDLIPIACCMSIICYWLPSFSATCHSNWSRSIDKGFLGFSCCYGDGI